MPTPTALAETAARHKLTTGAVQALADSLARGRGGGAQWNHPELGGMGQWSGGGMLQIGDMFNDELKGRVRAALDDLVAAGRSGAEEDGGTTSPSAHWWPAGLGQPSSTGSQNDMRYAFFPQTRRLAVSRGGVVTVYDTGEHRLSGFAQAQGPDQTLAFTGPDGRVTLDAFAILA